jgi:hypothetical protein
MKKKSLLWISAFLLMLAGCSSDDEIVNGVKVEYGSSDDDYRLPEGIGQNNLIPLYSSNDLSHNRKTNVETLGNWNVCIDDDGRYLWASLYDTGDPIEKLYAAPSSYEELSGKLFNLDDDHSLKLDTVEYYTDYEGYSRRADFYDEYYRGVPVLCGQYRFHFLYNPTEQHIHHCSGFFMSFDNLDVTPAITGDQAIQIFSTYLKKPSDSSWTATLYAREYHVRVEGETFRREQRLVYYVTGPAAKVKVYMGDWPNEIDTNKSAEIDAHTGQIIYVGLKNSIPF